MTLADMASACCAQRRDSNSKARQRHEAALAKFTGEDSEWSGTRKPSAAEKMLKVKGFQVALKFEIKAARKREARRLQEQRSGNEAPDGLTTTLVGTDAVGVAESRCRDVPSIECRALNRLFRRGRGLQNEKLSTVRQPGIACFAPASEEFMLRSEKLTNFAGRGFDCWRVPPACSVPAVAIFYVHGGGFVGGDWAGFRGYCEVLQQMFDGCPIFFPNYRMAPEVSIPDRASTSAKRGATPAPPPPLVRLPSMSSFCSWTVAAVE